MTAFFRSYYKTQVVEEVVEEDEEMTVSQPVKKETDFSTVLSFV
jgi:hypothetical protein